VAEVRVNAVTKSWGGAPAVDAVSFTVERGAFAALLGPSGCGKSTTLRMVAGLEDADAGAIEIDGRDVTHAPPSKRGVAMVFQNYALFPHLTVAQNILFGMEVRGETRAARQERLAWAADLLRLGALLDRKPGQLSGGQQQRVALGRAIVAQAPVCLMDEPLSNLDAQLRVEMRREIRDLQQRLGITMIYVTHDQVEAMTMADQVVLMREGRIEQDGPPDTLYEAPASVFAARFVGTPPMNVLPYAALQATPGAPTPPSSVDPADLLVGLRPENARIGEGGVSATVAAVEYLGADTLIEARVGDHAFVARAPGKRLAKAGEAIVIGMSQEATHWFNAQTGRRIPTDQTRP
jgi:sn-glycerol 3-phosphate transport system ATP-binding protein